MLSSIKIEKVSQFESEDIKKYFFVKINTQFVPERTLKTISTASAPNIHTHKRSYPLPGIEYQMCPGCGPSQTAVYLVMERYTLYIYSIQLQKCTDAQVNAITSL